MYTSNMKQSLAEDCNMNQNQENTTQVKMKSMQFIVTNDTIVLLK